MAESTSNAKGEWSRAVGAIVTLVLALLMLVGFVMLFGAVHGEEFSPANFTRRSFVFYRIPIIKFQVTPVIRKSTTNALEIHLANQLLPKINNSSDEQAELSPNPLPTAQSATAQPTRARWDVVRVTPLSRPPENGSAVCLCAYLDRTEGGASKWLTWTKAHPELASTLWPIVQQAAIDRLYFVVPDLMTAAEAAAERGPDAPALAQELKQIVAAAAQLRQQAEATSNASGR